MKIIISWRGDDGLARERVCSTVFGADELVRSLHSWGMTNIQRNTDTLPCSSVILGKVKLSYMNAGMSAHNADRRIRQMIRSR